MKPTERVVLLVEDNFNDELLALRALKKVEISMRVDVTRDGSEASSYLFNPDISAPDLVLLDLKLPKINGLEVLRSVRANPRTHRLPVVIFTSSNQREDVTNSFESGANSFVCKAVEYADYMSRMSKIAEYWLSINEPCQFASTMLFSGSGYPR